MISKHVFIIGAGLVLTISVLCLCCVDTVNADEVMIDKPSWRGGFHLGYSHYTGVLGVEVGKGHWGFTLGMPTAVGARYYLDESACKWFFGAHAMNYNVEENETRDGIRYDEVTETSAGLGAGYKWRWKNHWDLTLSVSLTYLEEVFENDYASRTEQTIMVIPGLTFGYTF